ncbi:hypothetical protein A5N82_07305 [Christensenella minuta]|uniref:Uncharacterized protein n=1 Tax=Christensenella minuta TaxID=626937 RepID=A0A136Q1Q7_9FIRM|nr:hypothetical protein B1H56_07640 [Christensenella minuta]KXK64595.1 hypothetical protein HMPREF3293_02675 [Christensenella minuta]OAQ37258.1 hypothetical protein A5N82_07305 [Christensenella minuta]
MRLVQKQGMLYNYNISLRREDCREGNGRPGEIGQATVDQRFFRRKRILPKAGRYCDNPEAPQGALR